MRRIVFDIETCAYPFESLSESQREYFLRYADKESDPEKRQMMIDDAVRYTSLYPYTSKCVVIGIYDVEKDKSYVYYESDKKQEWKSDPPPAEDKSIIKGYLKKKCSNHSGELLVGSISLSHSTEETLTFHF